MRVIAGPEKKARLLSEKEQRITAYHEMGHALVGHFLENTNPIHKITIVSRGQALGLTISLPTEDRYMQTKPALLEEIAMTLGGRAAEELVFNEVTTGAANDLEKITHTAKQMVMRYGMSEKLGPRVLGRDTGMPFLGREMGHEPDYSDEVAREIDDEVRRIIEDGHELALKVLREHMDDLHRISQILIEHETIDKDQFERLLAGEAEDDVFPPAEEAKSRARAEARARAPPARSRGRSRCPGRRCSRPSPKAPTSASRRQSGGELAAADRRALPPPVGDGRGQRHARLVLGRRRPSAAPTRRSRRRAGCSTTARRSSTSAASRPGPGSGGVPLDEELRRVVPVLEALAGAPVSIDTSKAEVARRALELGAELVNDVTALRGDPELAGVVAEAGAYVCLMHMRGEPRTMQADPVYDDVVSEVKAFLEERLAFAVAAGIREELVCLDPGIGFGKTVEHNFELVRRLDELVALGRPILVGFSRKSSLGGSSATRRRRPARTAASVGAAVAAFDRGATILRVHDVREHVEALRAAQAVAAR